MHVLECCCHAFEAHACHLCHQTPNKVGTRCKMFTASAMLLVSHCLQAVYKLQSACCMDVRMAQQQLEVTETNIYW